MGKAKQAIGIFLLVAVTVVGNWYYYKQRQKPQPSPIKKEVSSKNKKGLQFRLSEGEAQLPKRVPVVDAKELATADVESILSRLEPIKTDPNDQTEFALRESSLPPPKTGQVINTKFPPDKNIKSNEVTSSGSLEILRYSPKGEVPIAANLSITFSQPMVILNSQSEAAQNVPVKLSPQVAGQWRWLGTKTLVFEPKVRFPMSTLYFIEVPAGTKSATGQSLQAAVNWQFKTPTLTLKRYFPQGSGIDTNPVIFLEFDQEINKDTILQSIRVKSDKGAIYKTRLATQEEIASSPTFSLTKSAKEKYWVALKIDNGLADKLIAPLPKNTTINVSIEAGASSAEGPLKTVAKQDFSFTTYRPLRVEDNTCNEQKYPCPPTRYVNVRFNNFLDPKSLDLTKAEFSPKVEGLTIQLYAYNMNIKGKFKGNRVYKLKLEPGFVKDNFGQALETPTTLNFYMGASPKELTSLGGEFLVLDPFGPTKLPVFTTNHKELKVSLYAAQPTDWASFVQIRRKISEDYNYKKETYKEPVGRLISSEVVKLKSVDNEQIETAIDLSAAIQAGAGQVFVLIEPTEQPKEIYLRQYIRKWVQFTNIGLDATFDNEELLVWANSLKTGKPLAGVEINLRTISATTGADGIARIKLENASPSLKDVSCLIAKLGKDTAILPPSSYDPQAWTCSEQTNYLSWYVVDDRKTYRPGEKVTIKGWVRLFENKKGGDIKLAGEIKTVNYSLNDSQGNKISNGTAEVNPLGGFNLTLDLPATMNLGNANLSFEALPKTSYSGLQHSHNFQVQEFRRPEFEVSTTASENTNIIGGHSNVTVTASYYAGGTLNNAEVNWEATATPTNYTPPNRSDYTFGKWTPWWISDGHHGFGRYYGGAEESNSTGESFQGKTSPNGTHNLRIDFDSVNPAQPTSLNVQASVMDVNRQAWSSSSTLLVHPANLYVGLRSEKTFVGKDEPFIIKSIVTDIDGKIIPNVNIDLRLARIEYDYDSFGLLINSSGNTPNNYLYAGEQWDSNLALYYNRARYLDVNRGRFWSHDTFEGVNSKPLSLHKYLYAGDDPINKVDPSGHLYFEKPVATTLAGILESRPVLSLSIIFGAVVFGLALAYAGLETERTTPNPVSLPTPTPGTTSDTVQPEIDPDEETKPGVQQGTDNNEESCDDYNKGIVQPTLPDGNDKFGLIHIVKRHGPLGTDVDRRFYANVASRQGFQPLIAQAMKEGRVRKAWEISISPRYQTVSCSIDVQFPYYYIGQRRLGTRVIDTKFYRVIASVPKKGSGIIRTMFPISRIGEGK